MSFKSERRNSKKGNRRFTPLGSNAAQFKKAEINKDFIGTRVMLRSGKHLKKNDQNHSSFLFRD